MPEKLGEDALRLLRAAGERAGFADRGEVAIGLRWCGGRGHQLTCSGQSFTGWRLSLRKHPFDFGVRPGNDVDRDELADAPGSRRARIGRGLDRADVAADQHGDVAGADVFRADQRDLAALTIASAASTDPMNPRVSTIRARRVGLPSR